MADIEALLEKLRKSVDENLENDQFGVEELARSVAMSRSQLHRKLTSATGQSISQFIREHRLQRGMELVKEGNLTAAEISERVGFGSATYFNKCFNDYYGLPPGQVKYKMAEPGGEQQLTPVRESVPVVRRSLLFISIVGVLVVLLLAGMAYFVFERNETTIVEKGKSIAILPFRNLGTDPNNEYFGEGVIEAIRTSLSQVRDLRVIARTSVEKYRDSNKSAREIGEELGVSALLEGSIQRSDNKVRIDVRLVDASTQQQVWARTYDRELKDVFAIQTEIAQQVVDELNATLSPEEQVKLTKSDTDDPKAYDLYLKGVYEFRTYTNKGTHRAIELFTEAIKLDPNYAKAYAFLANGYIGLATIFGAELSAIEGLEKGKPFIDKALELDPSLAEAQMLIGFYKLYHDWDFKGAEVAYKQGVVSDHPDVLAVYADFLNFTQRHEEAMVWAERLNSKDPYYPNSRMVYTYIFNKRYDEALAFSEARLKMFNNYSTLDAHGFLLLNMGRYDEAITWFNKAIEVEGIRYPRMLGWMGAAYAKSGDKKKANELIEELKSRLANQDKASISFFISVIYAAQGDKPSALQWLETATASHDMEMPWLMSEPQFNPLKSEPRFLQIKKQVGFP
jgi:TolB-like protein/AraC-like DNA-binding protein/Tfp pilus assembly protein PilF